MSLAQLTASAVKMENAPNVSVHRFPADPAMTNAWVKFACKHTPHFTPSGSSGLCSAHFEACCFTPMSGVVPEHSSSKQITNLHKELVPTRDNDSLPMNDEVSATQQRQVGRAIFLQMLSLLLLSYLINMLASLFGCFPLQVKVN